MTDTSSNTDVPYIWNEDAEIEFVLMEEEAPPESLHSKREDIIHRMMHGRLLNPQIRRSRHIPGLIYAPAVLAGWYVFIVQLYRRSDNIATMSSHSIGWCFPPSKQGRETSTFAGFDNRTVQAR